MRERSSSSSQDHKYQCVSILVRLFEGHREMECLFILLPLRVIEYCIGRPFEMHSKLLVLWTIIVFLFY